RKIDTLKIEVVARVLQCGQTIWGTAFKNLFSRAVCRLNPSIEASVFSFEFVRRRIYYGLVSLRLAQLLCQFLTGQIGQQFNRVLNVSRIQSFAKVLKRTVIGMTAMWASD